MINVVNWNIGKREEPWRELVRMAGDGDADVALVQEAKKPWRGGFSRRQSGKPGTVSRQPQ